MSSRIPGIETDADDVEAAAFLQNLRRLIDRAGISDSALSRAVGRSRGWLSDLFKRNAAPSAVDCQRLAIALDCRIETLFGTTRKASVRSADEVLAERMKSLQHQRGYVRPDIHALIKWHIVNNGMLVNHEPYEDFFELFNVL